MIILGIHSALHDASAALYDDYKLLAAVQLERLTRTKGDGDGVPGPCIDEVLEIAGLSRLDVDVVVLTRMAYPYQYFTHWNTWERLKGLRYRLQKRNKVVSMIAQMRREGEPQAANLFDSERFLADYGFAPGTPIHFANHHQCHALPALFFTDWEDALLYTCDAHGDNVQFSIRSFTDGKLETHFGDDRWLMTKTRVDSIGWAYSLITRALGFTLLRHEGKITGLAAYGKPVLYEEMASRFTLDDDGLVDSDYVDRAEMARDMERLAAASRQDVAASIQKLLEDLILGAVIRQLELHPARHLGLSGGVFANVRLNRLLAENTSVDEVFVVPPMGDEGLSLGGPLAFLMERDGLDTWLSRRYRLTDVSLGRDYSDAADRVLSAGARCISDTPVETVSGLLAGEKIGAIFTGRMEFGPRALGNRSILANPSKGAVNDQLNRRLERTEFMPFAPVVNATHGPKVFDITSVNAYACRFMTVSCDVNPEWRERIPAVTHIDGSARPQMIERASNPLYFDILGSFHAKTGLPVLVNTSFNVHEEPIVNRPEESLRALQDGRVDFVATSKGVYMPR